MARAVFDRYLLIVCVAIAIGSIIYLFYWNRIIGFSISLGLRLMLWDQSAHSVRVNLGSINISILSGRILIKDFCYQSSNQTIKIVKLQVTWRYWIRTVAVEEDREFSHVGEDQKRSTWSLPCRVQIKMQGLEWLIYNRTAAYDDVVSQLRSVGGQPPSRTTTRSAPPPSTLSRTPYIGALLPRTPSPPVVLQKFLQWFERQLPNLDVKDLLPIGIQVSKGVIVCGNYSTPTLLVSEFKSANGTFGVAPARSKYDLYKQTLNLEFQHASIRLTDNVDYQGTMLSSGSLVKERTEVLRATPPLSYSSFAKFWGKLKRPFLFGDTTRKRTGYFPKLRGHKSSKDTPETLLAEYAIERKILEAPQLGLTYYADIVGPVPQEPVQPEGAPRSPCDIGNGDIPPEWGLDVVIRGGLIRYGPWADRQRAELQRAFFPSAYKDTYPTVHLIPGDPRMWTHCRVFIELRNETALYMPFREASKDWMWDGQSNMPRPKTREAASIHITAGDMSSISYVVPMVATEDGYDARLEVHLDSVTVTSSLNDIQLSKAESCRIRGELPSPLKWNAERDWTFAITLRQPIMYLLRDHINMFTDLARDWSSGPPADYFRFVPTNYVVEVELVQYELNFYLNDHNVIDKPLTREDNAILRLSGPSLKNGTRIASNTFRPAATTVPFTVDIPNPQVRLLLPRWHTYAPHSPKGGFRVLVARTITLTGSYLYYADVRSENVEQLQLELTGVDVALLAIGWAIRYFLVLRENYLGSFTHFTTLYEYLDKRRRGYAVGDPVREKYREGTSNMMQVELAINIQNGQAILPAGLPGSEQSGNGSEEDTVGPGIILLLPELQLQLRLHDYYMEMGLNIDSINAYIVQDLPHLTCCVRTADLPKSEHLFIDGIDITANRLFGPQPTTTTYFCIWEIHLGQINGDLSLKELSTLDAARSAFGMNYTDAPNVPSDEYTPKELPDGTYVKVQTGSIDVLCRVNNAAAVLSLPKGIGIDFNDIAVLLSQPGRTSSYIEVAEGVSDAYIDIYSAPFGWQDSALAQSSFIESEDMETSRAKNFIAQLHHKKAERAMQHVSEGLYLYQPCLYLSGKTGTTPIVTDFEDGGFQFSESEAESTTLDVDRDTKLAESRVLTPRPPLQREHEDMSGGDESDDEDLSDRDYTTDDDAVSPSSLLSGRYASCSRVGTLAHTPPSQWNRGPFRVQKDSRPYTPLNHHENISVQVFQSSPLAENGIPKNYVSTTTFRIKSHHGVGIWLSPLVTLALSALETESSRFYATPELVLDSLIIGYLKNHKVSTEAKQTKRTCVLIDVASVRLDFVQLNSDDRFPIGLSHQAICMVTSVDVEKCTFSADLVEQDPFPPKAIMNFSVSDLRCTVDVKGGLGFEPVILRMLSLEGDGTNSCLDVALTGIQLETGHSGPELLSCLIDNLAQEVPKLSQTIKTTSAQFRASYETILRSALGLTVGAAVVDSLSTIQPSYLVQSGYPHELRSDTVFRFLHHLRSALRSVPIQQRSQWETSSERNQVDSLVQDRLVALFIDMDAEGIETIKSMFLGQREPARVHVLDGLTKMLSVRLTDIGISISEPGSAAHSQLTMSSFQFVVRHRCAPTTLLDAKSAVLSQTSLRNVKEIDMTKVAASLAVGDVFVSIQSRLFQFIQHMLHIHQMHTNSAPSSPTANTEPSTPPSTRNANVLFTASLQRLRVQAAAETLTFEFGIAGLQNMSNILFVGRSGVPHSANQTLSISKVHLAALKPTPSSLAAHYILAEFSTSSVKLNILLHHESHSKLGVRAIWSIEKLLLSIPRSALRLYRFFEQWRSDYLPKIESTMKHGLFEKKSQRKTTTSGTRQQKHSLSSLHVQGKISSVGASLQVMHHTWFTWELQDCAVSAVSSTTSIASEQYFWAQMQSQVIAVTSKVVNSEGRNSTPRLKLALPAISFSARRNGATVQFITSVDKFHAKLKPSHWDTILSVQQKFGRDFEEFMSVVKQGEAQTVDPPTAKSQGVDETKWNYTGVLQTKGFRVGLQAEGSTLFFECDDIGGEIDNSESLNATLRIADLALSLAPQSIEQINASAFSRVHRTAFVTVDVNLHYTDAMTSQTSRRFQISVTKMHAVMQPSSIGEAGDFMDHLHAEIVEQQEQRVNDYAALKENTRSVLRSLEVKTAHQTPVDNVAWFQGFAFELNVKDIGVAFPLALHHSSSRSQIQASRAFLMSIPSVSFSSQHGERGYAIMKGFSFQFVSRFRQNVPTDFAGSNHRTRNRIVYPEMKAQVRLETSGRNRRVQIGASVSGFVLDLDSSVPDYIFSLIDVYREGKERVGRLAASIPRPPPENITVEVASPYKQPPSPTNSNIILSLTFLSGELRLHSGLPPGHRKMSQLFYDEPEHPEIFRVPVVSVWSEYKAASNAHDNEPPILMFKTTVHSSENTLKPTLLPFVSELVQRVETRMRQNIQSPPTYLTPEKSFTQSALLEQQASASAEAVSSMQISFSLRIDSSKLLLTCQPDVNVVAGLNWQSGGFIVNVSPGARQVSLTGIVGGLTAGLRHGFLSEDCVRLDARNVAFSVHFAKTGMQADRATSSISVVVDTEFSGLARFSRLQDILCFKAVWLDRIPVINPNPHLTPQSQDPKTPLTPFAPIAPMGTAPELATAVLVRVRHVNLEVDLGSSISSVTLKIEDALARSKLTENSSEVSITIADIKMSAKGNMAGSASVPSFVFQTIRRREAFGPSGPSAKSRMLEICMTSGPLELSLESEHQKLLYYHAEPLQVQIFDDWSDASFMTNEKERPVWLSFLVSGTEIVAVVTVGTIPKLLSYVNKFKANLAMQREGAARESKAFRSTRSPQPENPLSAVANAALQSARDRYKEAEPGLSYMIHQRISLSLELLRLIVFPRTMGDIEMAQFVGRDVQAMLDRVVGSETVSSSQDLHLSLSSILISKFIQPNHNLPNNNPSLDHRQWLDGLFSKALESNIAGLPTMDIKMFSEESMEDGTSVLTYDFDSRFLRKEGTKELEDIYITLNVSLYSWLTLLRKNFAREMEAVQAVSDWRSTAATLAAMSVLQKKTDGTGATSSRGNSGIYGNEPGSSSGQKRIYRPRKRHIERLTMRQLGEATPDLRHPFFMKTAGFSLEDSLPQYVSEYATAPLQEIMEVLLKVYSRQLLSGNTPSQ